MVKLKCWFWILINYVACASATFTEDVTFVRFRIDSGPSGLQCVSEELGAEVGGRFQVILYHGTHQVNNPRCQKSLGSEIYVNAVPTTISGTHVYVSSLLKVANSGVLNYECVFYTKYSDCNYFDGSVCHMINNGNFIDEGIKCTTKINIKNVDNTAVNPVISSDGLAVNEQFLPRHGEQTYHFISGEGANFKCHKTGGYPKMTYTSGGKKIEIQQAESVSMYIQLRAKNSGDVLTCEFYDQRVHDMRLTLNHNQTIGVINFVVDALLTLQGKLIGDTFHYEYKFYSGESLKINIVYDDSKYEKTTCLVDGSYIPFSNNQSHSLYQLKVATDFLCTVVRKHDQKRFSMIVKLVLIDNSYSPFITGLQTSHVLLQYSNANTTTIKYKIGNEKLTLYCSREHWNEDRWSYNENHIKTTHQSNSFRSFQLRPLHNNSIIQCMDHSLTKTTNVKLIRGNDARIPTNNAALPTVNPRDTSRITRRPTISHEPTADRTINHVPTADRKTSHEPTADRKISQEPTADRTISHEPTADRTISHVPTADRKTSHEPTADRKISHEPTADRTISHEPTADRKISHEPTADRTISHVPTADRKISHEPTADRTISHVPTADRKISHEPTADRTITTPSPQTTTIAASVNNPIPEGVIWTILVIVVLLILFIAVIVWKKFNHKKNRLLDNTSALFQSPMDMPPQWNLPDEVVYDEPDSLYNIHTKQCNGKTMNPEPTYANPRDSIRQPKYANSHLIDSAYTSVQNNEAAYASVQNNEPANASVKKNEPTYANQSSIEYQNQNSLEEAMTANKKRNKEGNNSKESVNPYDGYPKNHNQKQAEQNSNDLPYAEIYLKNTNDGVKSPKMPAYSEIAQKQTYVNLLEELRSNNQGYINAGAGNAVEPAYSEIMKL